MRPAWMGTLRRTTPLSTNWGFDRGRPVDRYYIEQFLQRHREDIRGRVLEVQDGTYTDMFGCGVEQQDVLDVDVDNPMATLVADLGSSNTLPPDQFDCFIMTQTLQLVYDLHAAVWNAYRVLRPGGVLLATVPGLSRVEADHPGYADYWRFTLSSCSLLFQEVFGAVSIEVRAFGNVLASIAFLTGMAEQELSAHELDAHDPAFPLVITVRAVKDVA